MDETMERTFTVSGAAVVRVSNIRGPVDVQPGEDGQITITAVKHVDTGDAERTVVEIEQAADGSVRARTELRKRWEWFFDWRQPCAVDYTVRVPRSCQVRVRNVSGEIKVQDLEGEFSLDAVSGALYAGRLAGSLKARSVSGRMEIEEVSGSLELRTVSGSLRGTRLTGPLEAQAVSGQIELQDSTFPSARLSTVSGGVEIEVLAGAGPYRFKSVSGRVEVVLPAGGGCTVETRSVSGRLRTDLPITREWGHERERGAEIQGGGPGISFSSVSGDLRVRQSAGETLDVQPAPAAAAASPPPPPPPAATPTPPSPPAAAPPVPPNARREIIDRIARGELTAAEGVIELQKLQRA